MAYLGTSQFRVWRGFGFEGGGLMFVLLWVGRVEGSLGFRVKSQARFSVEGIGSLYSLEF